MLWRPVKSKKRRDHREAAGVDLGHVGHARGVGLQIEAEDAGRPLVDRADRGARRRDDAGSTTRRARPGVDEMPLG